MIHIGGHQRMIETQIQRDGVWFLDSKNSMYFGVYVLSLSWTVLRDVDWAEGK